MKKVYYLKTCSTCSRIMSGLDLEGFEQIEIKSQGILKEQIEEMYSFTQSYENLFSKTAMKYRALKLNEKVLTEEDFKSHIISEYTFLKRPVFIIGNEIFIGSSKKTIELLNSKLG